MRVEIATVVVVLTLMLATVSMGANDVRAEDKTREFKSAMITEQISMHLVERVSGEVVEEEVVVASRSVDRSYLGVFEISYYCCENYPHICNNGDSTYTASGSVTTPGRTIACGKYPFGTKLMIDGHVYVVEDRGGAVKGNHIDVVVPTHAEALQLGVQYKDVYLVE